MDVTLPDACLNRREGVGTVGRGRVSKLKFQKRARHVWSPTGDLRIGQSLWRHAPPVPERKEMRRGKLMKAQTHVGGNGCRIVEAGAYDHDRFRAIHVHLCPKKALQGFPACLPVHTMHKFESRHLLLSLPVGRTLYLQYLSLHIFRHRNNTEHSKNHTYYLIHAFYAVFIDNFLLLQQITNSNA